MLFVETTFVALPAVEGLSDTVSPEFAPPVIEAAPVKSMRSAVRVMFLPSNTAELASVNLLPAKSVKSEVPVPMLPAVRLPLADMLTGVAAPVVLTNANVASPV